MIERPSTAHPDPRNEDEELLDGVEIDVDYESDSLGSSNLDEVVLYTRFVLKPLLKTS